MESCLLEHAEGASIPSVSCRHRERISVETSLVFVRKAGYITMKVNKMSIDRNNYNNYTPSVRNLIALMGGL
jgi:hypothetical protein